MTLNLTLPSHEDLRPRITVFGVGGAGGNAVNNMIEMNLEGVEFIVANTDAQALQQSNAPTKVQMGLRATEGLGAGARPSVGAAAAEEALEEIVECLTGAHMCFITAGMGGGTGTGAAPIIAHAARELGVLTIGVVTKPFQFEGAKRMMQAEEGVEELQRVVDTLIIIPNQNLFRIANEKTTFTEAFSMADDVLYQGVKGVTDLMVRPGLINLDFADVRSVMDEMGKAMMGTGEAEGEDRAVKAAEMAIANPLLDEISLQGANGVLINITGSEDVTLFEIDEAANRIRNEVESEANIIVGSTLDTAMQGRMRVSVVATGIDSVPHTQIDTYTPMEELDSVEEPEPEPEVAPEQVFEPELAAVAHAVHEEDRSLFGEAAHEAVAEARHVEAEVQPLSAEPRPPAELRPVPGAPSPEVIARLERVAGREPGSMAGRIPGNANYGNDLSEAPGTADRPKFGINNLINRMSGRRNGSADLPSAEPRFDDAVREGQVGDESMEIPAFLRRQAN